MNRIISLIAVVFFAGCATTTTKLGVPQKDFVTVTGHSLKDAVTAAADIYIERKAGNTDYVHSIAQGLRAYGVGMSGYQSVKAALLQFTQGRKPDESFIDSIATYFSSSAGKPVEKAEAIAVAIENKALTK